MGNKGRYVKVATRFWTDEKVIEMDPEAKILYLYCLSSPHSNMAGYYRLPKQYIKADLNLSDEQLNKQFSKLLNKELIKYCNRSSVILIPNYFKYNTIQNVNQAKGAANRTSELPKNSLVKEYIQVIRTYADKYYEELEKGLPKEFNQVLGNTDTDTDTDIDTDNNSCSDSEESANEIEEIKFDSESMPYRAAKYLRILILENNSREPVPDEDPKSLEEWAIELDRLNRLGPVGCKDKGYSWKEIGRIMEWCQDDSFWKKTIKSASKFRKQITKLEDRMQGDSSNKSKQKEKDDRLARIYQQYQNEEESVDVL